jgi:uncharacterized protein
MQSKIKATLIVGVVFLMTLIAMGLVANSPLGRWEIQVLGRPFLVNLVMMAVPLLVIAGTRQSLAAYGIVLTPFKYHLSVALTCALPVAVAAVANVFLDYRRWEGALPLIAISVALLLCLAWLLRNRPSAGVLTLAAFVLLPASGYWTTSGPSVGKAISAFLFFLFFIGPAEEILFRGYIQSRLNQAFGRPYRFFGVNWGLGAVVTALFFGLMHFLNLTSLYKGQADFQVWWGLWTFFGSLTFSFVREKTGSVLAPAILHGFPQAIAYPLLGL